MWALGNLASAREINTEYLLCGSCIRPKKTGLKFKLLAFCKKQTPFIDQKCTYEKVAKNWAGPSSPTFGQNPKEQQFFLVKPSPIFNKTMMVHLGILGFGSLKAHF